MRITGISAVPTATSDSTRSSALVLHLIASGGLYGIERMLLGLLPALQRREYDVALVCLSASGSPGGEIGAALSQWGVPVYYCSFGSRASVKGLMQLHAVIKVCRPELLHVHGYKATILGGSLGFAKRIPTVGTFHTEAGKWPEVSHYARIETHIIRRLQGMVAVSEPIRRELEQRRVPADKIRVIPNGIPDAYPKRGLKEALPGLSDRSPLLVFVGRLSREKGVGLLIDAVYRLRSEFPRIALAVAGEGPNRQGLERQVDALEMGDSVRFLGYVNDPGPLLAACDCFVLPSQTEGMPIAMLEAMSFAAPIVATAVGSIPSVVRDGTEAILVPPSNGRELLGALTSVLRDNALRDQLGKSARERFLQEFVSDRMAARYVEFYDAVLGTAPSLRRV